MSRKITPAFSIALVALFGALYVTLMFVFAPMSFGPIQFRVANILMGAVPIFGVPAILGIALGVFIGNMWSSLGLIDLASAAVSLIFLYVVWYLRNKSVMLGLTIYSVGLGIWVAGLLALVFALPFVALVGYLIVGIWLATGLCGWMFYKALNKYIPAYMRAEGKKST